jgi:FtsP/CotA-like multicopper oxidase with cupredoxin domain
MKRTMTMAMAMDMHIFLLVFVLILHASQLAKATIITEQKLQEIASSIEMFVDELPEMPTLQGYTFYEDGQLKAGELRIGMFEKKWKFHRDFPASRVFAYGTSKESASVPGPTIEAIQGVETFVAWENHLPSRHFLPWDPTVVTAMPEHGGVPTVVHLHGGITEPQSDGSSLAWFTAGFKETGPAWTKTKYHYVNVQHPGSLWYHDHALGLTRVNVLAGLVGAYIIRNPAVEESLKLPSGREYEHILVVFDKSFAKDGSIYMNSTGDNPSIHPQWQPEYFGDAIIVNGKAWPFLKVKRRKYRFRIVNTSNARFYRFALSNGLSMTQIGSDSAYLARPVRVKKLLVAPSEIADVIIDFADSSTDEVILTNSAAYPFPSGNPVDNLNSKVMKFVIEKPADNDERDSRIPETLVRYPRPNNNDIAQTRYITLFEYDSATGNPTHSFLNGLPFLAPATETPRQGTSELWNIINLTPDTHPIHIHLGLFLVLKQTKLLKLDEFNSCMLKKNDAVGCNIEKHAKGRVIAAPANERTWKNVFKMQTGFMTTILLRFSLLDSHEPYPFNASAEPGYVYHCHILDHEDNEMMRPFKIVS